jgi:predicted nucleic acid-binding protein
MNGRNFFDTNVLVYSLDDRDPTKMTTAIQLLSDAVSAGIGVISYQVIQEILNVAFRRFREPISSSYAAIYVEKLLEDFEVVQWSSSLVQRAIAIRERDRFSWYDCLIVSAALEAHCEVLYSEDLQHGQCIEGLTVVNPFL